MRRLIRILTNAWWKLVFRLKHRAGFIDLGRDVVVTGVVLENYALSDDGDACFSILPDHLSFARFAMRLTSEVPSAHPVSLHCEVPPWADEALRFQAFALPIGKRVSVCGRWGFDGCHLGRGRLWDIVMAILGHGPEVTRGFCEIHPVTRIELLEDK